MFRPLRLLAFAVLAPVVVHAESHGLKQARNALAAARQESDAHRAAAARAQTLGQAQAAKAAVLGQQQVTAAASVRKLEDRTAQAAGVLDDLQDQTRAAAGELQRNAAALAALLPVIQRLAAEPAATLLAVPGAPVNAVRGVMVMQGLATEIARRATAVRQQTADVARLTSQTLAGQAALMARLAVQNDSEATLTAQIAAAKSTELAAAGTAASERAAALAADRRLRDLNDIVAKLRAVPTPPAVPGSAGPHSTAAIAGGRASGGAPVAGTVIQKFGDGTVAGPAQGVSYRAAPGARVVTPCAGPVKFADRFQSYGLVVITDCGRGYYAVLSGLQHLDVTAGETLVRRQPVGEMLGFNPAEPTRQPVLYLELRHNGTPVDPTGWLAGGSG